MREKSFIRSVNLDKTTDEIRKKVPNFSGFVRQCLNRYASQVNSQNQSCNYTDSLILYEGKCNPLNASRPICFYCWPNGAPTRELVRAFRLNSDIKKFIDQGPLMERSSEYVQKFGSVVYDPNINMEWLQNECYAHNSMLVQIDDHLTKESQESKPRPQKSKFSRILSILRGK